MSAPATSNRRRTIGAVLLVCLSCFVYFPGYWNALSSHTRIGDFFQEWASARNYFEGLPVYAPQEQTAWKYLGYRHDPNSGVFVRINGHPPASILLGLPFAKLEYSRAFLLWNLMSIVTLAAAAAMLMRFELGLPRAVHWLLLLSVLLSNCLLQHLTMGQLGAPLLLLLVGTAIADDRNRPVTAGVLLGLATGFKLFPGLLFLYFLINRKWRTVAVGAATVVAVNGLAAALFGLDSYSHYVRYAAPEVLRYRDWWANYSITGLWFKLFDGTSGQTIPLWFSPTTAKLGAQISVVAAVLTMAYFCLGGRANRESRRTSLALFVVVMVLASPVAWDHYFLLLTWPLVRLAARLPRRAVVRVPFYASLAVLWLNPLMLWIYCTNHNGASTPGEVLTFLSLPFYALFTVLLLTVYQLRRDIAEFGVERDASEVLVEPSLANASRPNWEPAPAQ